MADSFKFVRLFIHPCLVKGRNKYTSYCHLNGITPELPSVKVGNLDANN